MAMRKFFEVFGVIAFVAAGTYLAYSGLADLTAFWESQFFWSIVLSVGWVIVSFGYFHQGWLVYKDKSSAHVSVVLPATVFVVQCVLFIKGVHYSDWSLIAGAMIVNSGVVFSLYQIFTNRKKRSLKALIWK